MKKLLDIMLLIIKKMPYFFPLCFKGNVKTNDEGIEYVGGFKRQISVLFDLIILIIFLYLMSNFFYNLLIKPNNAIMKVLEKYQLGVILTEQEQSMKSNYITLLFIAQFLQLFILFFSVILCWTKYSATPGKLLLGLRIVDAKTFKRITFFQATKRFFSFILSVLPLFLGILWANFDSRRQTWHDKIAGTVVVTYRSIKDIINS